MATAIEVARYLVQLAAEQEEPDALTHLRIQKLLYYAQGWHLAVYGTPLFIEAVEAWMHGPVIREVYGRLKAYGKRGVDLDEIDAQQSLGEEQRTYLQRFWESFRDYSAHRLYQMSHAEQPWIDARASAGPDPFSNQEISQQTMRDFFRAGLIPGLDPLASWKGLEEAESGSVRTHQDVFAGLGGNRCGS